MTKRGRAVSAKHPALWQAAMCNGKAEVTPGSLSSPMHSEYQDNVISNRGQTAAPCIAE